MSRKSKRWLHIEFTNAIKAMVEIDKAESIFNRSVLKTEDPYDVIAIMKLIENRHDKKVSDCVAKYFKLYLNFVGYPQNVIAMIGKLDDEYIKGTITSPIYSRLTKEALIEYCKYETDSQYKILPLLLFVGVGIGKKEVANDEVRTIRKKSITSNGIHLTGPNARFLELEEDMMYCVNQAKNRGMHGKNVKAELANSPFLLNSQSNFAKIMDCLIKVIVTA